MERKLRRARGQKGKDKPMGEAEHGPISLNQVKERAKTRKITRKEIFTMNFSYLC